MFHKAARPAGGAHQDFLSYRIYSQGGEKKPDRDQINEESVPSYKSESRGKR